jgi:hypothetical protein
MFFSPTAACDLAVFLYATMYFVHYVYLGCLKIQLCNMPVNNRSVIDERRQKLFALLTRGMKGYEIARELNTDQVQKNHT